MTKQTQLIVMDQTTGAGGTQSCGYHTLKNSLLALMHMQGIINEQQFETLRKDKPLFDAIYKDTVQYHGNTNNTDVSLPTFMDLLARMKKGDFDFSAHGVSKEDLKKLNLTPDGTQNITVANYRLDMIVSGHGLAGMEEDLLVAAATVKLARTKGVAHHVFALGINDEHWVTAAVSQDAHGERTWQFMDSWHNQTLYQKTVIGKIEAILNKNEQELNDYLLQAYENSHSNLNPYANSLNPVNGLPLEGEENEVQQQFNQDAPRLATWLERRFNFMQTNGWLDAPGEQEKVWITHLYHMANFLNAHTLDNALENQLQPICARLKSIVSPAQEEDETQTKVQDETIDETAEQKQELKPGHKQDETDENLKEQQRAAMHAVSEGQPKPTEGIIARFVKGIKFLWEGIKSAIEHVARTIGLVQ
ncbi:hypothetical protein [Legionella drancourtii]|uniref:Uncharacterized protein n=1 Tax=Legionella drancourtii LLAP12 TaxID=658187 RepID=G9ETI7_9GAMM|nr:hypothetical protein [Legionella drancourtii]EHL29654.1 hypothetical protein LDG_8619 [Legionella drancourtii LLAP12]